MIAKSRKALLLRVGMDRGTGGALGPIFDDGAFEYIPIPERQRTRESRTYATLPGQHGRPLAAYLSVTLASVRPHVDPDFTTATYGDAAPRKRWQLGKLTLGDLLVFYCGLMPYPPNDVPHLFIVGYLYVKRLHRLIAADVSRLRRSRHRFRTTAHFLRSPPDRDLVLVEGEPNMSRLFTRALPLGDRRDHLLRDLERLGYQGSIQRAVGHWVCGDAAMGFLEAWLKQGPPILVGPHSRLFLLPVSALVRLPNQQRRDIEITVAGRSPEAGDWILILDNQEASRIIFFGRVNHRKNVRGRPRAFSSLFWHFGQDGPLASKVIPSSAPVRRLKYRRLNQPAVIRRIISGLFHRYRCGFFQADGTSGQRG